jgi:hypothetical protein
MAVMNNLIRVPYSLYKTQNLIQAFYKNMDKEGYWDRFLRITWIGFSAEDVVGSITRRANYASHISLASATYSLYPILMER